MMKRLLNMICILSVTLLAGCSDSSVAVPSMSEPAAELSSAQLVTTPDTTQLQTAKDSTMPTVTIQIGTSNFTAILYDNESAHAIIREMPFTLVMDDYAGQEKVTELAFDLPGAVRETPATINAGDIYLWSGNSLVLFYTTFPNSYSYVPVGYIEDVSGFRDALGSGSAEVTFSAEN